MQVKYLEKTKVNNPSELDTSKKYFGATHLKQHDDLQEMFDVLESRFCLSHTPQDWQLFGSRDGINMYTKEYSKWHV